jgi:hypothetical protein
MVNGHTLTNQSFQALISAVVMLAGDLDDIINQSKNEVKTSPNGAQQAHVEQLLERLIKASNKAKENISRQDEKIIGEITWDNVAYDRYVIPNTTLLTVPKAAEDAMMTAVKRGATSAALIHELIVSELVVGLARWRVAFTSNLNMGPHGVA